MPDTKANRAKAQARKAAALKKSYQLKLKAIKAIGVYEPKSSELTRYRKTRINKAYKAHEQYVSPRLKNQVRGYTGPDLDKISGPDHYFFVSADKLSKSQRKEFLRNARSLDMVTTPRGVILEREGHRKARIKYDKRRDEFDIVLTGKVKRGPDRGKVSTQRIPVAPLDHLQDEEKRLRAMAQSFGPLGPNDILSFKLYDNHVEVGAHRGTYDSVAGVMNALNQYHKDNKGARLAFFRLVTVQKSTMTQWVKDHPSSRTARNKAKGSKRKMYAVEQWLNNAWHEVDRFASRKDAQKFADSLQPPVRIIPKFT